MFNQSFLEILNLIRNIKFINIIDILIVSYIFYRVFLLLKETRAETLMKGIILILIIMTISKYIGLLTLYWLINKILTIGFIAFVIIFQPEIRRALEHLGRSRFFNKRFDATDTQINNLTSQIVEAVINLSRQKTGALIVIEQETGLNDYIETGVKLDCIITSQILENVFVVNTPLHDGAVIIRNDRIAAAACFLPLSENYGISKKFGTRHRAALGISENSDAIAVIVSEETGNISLAINGKITRNYNAERLKDILIRIMKHKTDSKTTFWKKVSTWTRQKFGI